jgi:hypothetical protein
VLNKLSTTHVKGNTLKKTSDGWEYMTKRRALPVLLVGNQLVVGNGTPAALRAFATAPTAPASGAQGSVAFRISLSELVNLALHNSASSSQIARSILSQITDLTGSSSVSTSGLTGDATLGVH